MQLGAKETENERFAHYLTKTYRKTASLIAASLKAVSFNEEKGKKKIHREPNPPYSEVYPILDDVSG